jgi:hypothetical protein
MDELAGMTRRACWVNVIVVVESRLALFAGMTSGGVVEFSCTAWAWPTLRSVYQSFMLISGDDSVFYRGAPT